MIYVIFDDNTLDCPEVEAHWVKVDFTKGITQADVILDNYDKEEISRSKISDKNDRELQ